VALLGWSPGGERESSRCRSWWRLRLFGDLQISPPLFDKDKLTISTREYIRAMRRKAFTELGRLVYPKGRDETLGDS
jgi:hypothetical protein